jgi:hypothetical protein
MALAEELQFFDKEKGIHKTMIEVQWKSDRGYYLMDMSSFSFEQEVVIMDGASFTVENVEETYDQN